MYFYLHLTTGMGFSTIFISEDLEKGEPIYTRFKSNVSFEKHEVTYPSQLLHWDLNMLIVCEGDMVKMWIFYREVYLKLLGKVHTVDLNLRL